MQFGYGHAGDGKIEHLTANKSPKWSTWLQSQKQQNDFGLLPRQVIEHYGNPSLCHILYLSSQRVLLWLRLWFFCCCFKVKLISSVALVTGLQQNDSVYIFFLILFHYSFPGGSDGKASAYNAGDPSLIRRRSSGEGNGNPLQYSCLENPMDRGAWWATVHGVAKSRKALSDFTFTYFFWFFSIIDYYKILNIVLCAVQ